LTEGQMLAGAFRDNAAIPYAGVCAEAASHAAEGTHPSADITASTAYRERLACVLVARAMAKARQR
jgi:CO/xanthine dehydrogenase FAD-binding subunit